MIGIGFAISATAMAQPSAQKGLLRRSSETYVRYIGHDEDNSNRGRYLRGSLDAQVAATQCKQGNAAEAIPVLERTLTQQKFTLPARG